MASDIGPEDTERPGGQGDIVRQAVFAPILHRGESPRRLLTTVLFTDIVGSTQRAAALGDRGWKDLLARHHAIVRRELRRFHGRELDTAGDGFFATFERPIQAIECATTISDALRPLDLQIRAGIHMGEAEVMGGKVGGLTVHVASRALAQAGPGEILVTNTVREVTAGADVTFIDRGVHQLKGVPGRWRVYAVVWQRREVPAPALGAPGAADLGVEAMASRRWRWLAAAGAGLVGTAVIAVTAYALLSHGTAAPIVPQPDSAIRIDPATNAIAASVAVGDDPTGIVAGDDTVWVLSLGSKLLTGIPVAGGSSRTIGLPGPPTGLAADESTVWVSFGFGAAGESAGMVLPVSAITQKPGQAIPIGNGASAIALDAHGVWVVNGLANTLTKIDPGTRSVVATVTVGEQPVAVTTGEGSVWVANAVSKSIWRLDPLTMTKTKEIALADPPTAIAVGFGRLWVTSDAGHTLAVIDAPTNGLMATVSLDQGPRGVAAGPDAVWVAGARGALLRIDPVSRTVSRSIALPGPAEGVSVLDSSVWVTVQR